MCTARSGGVQKETATAHSAQPWGDVQREAPQPAVHGAHQGLCRAPRHDGVGGVASSARGAARGTKGGPQLRSQTREP